MTIAEIRTVCFVGAGTMGCANSLVAAVSGYHVVLHDAQGENLDAVAARHAEMAGYLLQTGYCTAEDISAARKRVSVAPELAQATSRAELVSESVFEDLALKQQIHRQLDEMAPPGTILTTNTSALRVADIEGVVERGALFAALHSHLGALLFDIVAGPRTAPTTIDILRGYVLSLGGVPLVLKKDHPGYLFNAMNGPLLGAAMRLVLDGHATKEEVDRAWMSDRGAPMGPFGMIDLFGLDLILSGWQRPAPDASREAMRAKAVPFLSGYVDEGKLGRKTGEGFYRYPSPAFEDPSFLSATPDSPLASDTLLGTLILSAVSLLANDVAAREDIDLAWTAATGLGIGPLAILDRLGIEGFIAVLEGPVAAGLIASESRRAAEAYLVDQRGGPSGC